MNRKVLLVEPNYKNKYPPMGLMKLATYYRQHEDDVRFFKGDMKNLAVELICEDLLTHLEMHYPEIFWRDYYPILFEFIRLGKQKVLDVASSDGVEIFKNKKIHEILKEYRGKYKNKDYFTNPRFDKVGITTLFTFGWDITIETINFAKQLCKDIKDVMVGGIMSSVVPDEVYKATGIHPRIGLLNHPGDIDEGDPTIIDLLPLDYSILEEIDYKYPASNAYFSYTTRGCVNHCKFCVVPKLEPKYCDFVGLKKHIENTDKRFGKQGNLLLLDNNVLASKSYDRIIDEIKECGFGKEDTYVSSNEYDIMINNLRDSYNERAYVRKAVKLYEDIMNRLKDETLKKELYEKLRQYHCLHMYSATKKNILALDEYIRPLYVETHKINRPKKRVVDFNQGIDSRLITHDKMKKLAEINISPLRIAFDHWKLRNIYEKSVRMAASNGINKLSNYMLYNFEDTPDELYYRLKLNIDLCDELGIYIYSFPMKYHPLDDKKFFSNRNYIGKHWNKKFIRSIQSILNLTKGKVGRGKELFEEIFGSNIEEYRKILWMPETFVIYRRVFDEELRSKLADKYTKKTPQDCNLANEWWYKFQKLSPEKLEIAESIISKNKFRDGEFECDDDEILDIISYYRIEKKD